MTGANAGRRAPAPAETASGVQPSPAVRLHTFALAALANAIGADRAEPEALYLRAQRAAVLSTDDSCPAALERYLRSPGREDKPLLALAHELQLTLLEVLAVALAAAVEGDTMTGRALAYLQAPVGGARPTLGLIASLSDLAGETRGIERLATGAALDSGLLAYTTDTAPLPERALSVPLPTFLALRGGHGAWPGTSIGFDVAQPVPLPPSILAEAARRATALVAGANRALVVRSGSSAEARAVAAAIAQAIGLRPAFIETEKLAGLGPWLWLQRLLPVFSHDIGPGERKMLPAIARYRGPTLAICGPDGMLERTGEPVMSWRVPVPPREERETLWRDAVGDGEGAAILAREHRHPAGRISQLGRQARFHAAVRGASQPTIDDVIAAARGGGSDLGALAQLLPDPIPDEALVLPPQLQNEMETLLARCRARDGLTEGLGVSARARYYPGARALFVGPSGTGKTIAAGWLATRLRMPLYRVDLASVTSKYIGETEKNLAQLLARAEHADVVLLFDEADSLFGKRTDVKEANDRFANAQTNYLLQRIESFDGVVVLTSNSRARFDSAFTRRLDAIVEFPVPGPEERRALWKAHLGENHAVTQRELNQIAATVDLCGGHIRNVVLAAAVAAQTRNHPIAHADLVAGIVAEYRKLGQQAPANLAPPISR